MVRISHAKCRRCGQTRHRNAKRNLCGSCWAKEKHHVQDHWREIKARRAAKREALVSPEEVGVPLSMQEAIEEVLAVPNGHVERAPRTRLTPEQKQEIVDLYMNTDTPVKEIASTYGVPETAPFRLLGEFGISWRRGDRMPESRPGPKRELPPHIEAMKEVHVAPTREPVAAVAPNGQVPAVDLEEGASRWSVVYVTTATLTVRADTFDQAAAKARAYLDPGIEIEMVRRERA